eukprot:gnl/TRDRNA2_/TRDRNA2_159792_c2_seq1.p1 gnl/TRDRNA2_/TRDRNA2_159792_c2~~gnl/TRDRNA2_/TRDRNA2_159792_c2_seq1.p1  ORF type:complete len:167 (+),score=34.99 gnl/TRDRNA2_/TRDRNA2_159792_c2_seq1:1-501(+)
MIDRFTWDFSEHSDVTKAVREWNVLQAVIRKACGTIEYCFFALQTTVLFVVMFMVADVALSAGEETASRLPLLVPGTMITVGIARIFFSAAAVTDKCARVPALVNSLSFGKDIDMERQYVVDYIINSAAGFYIFEVRLTSAMALKFAYLMFIIAFGVGTKVMSSGL